MGWPKIPKKKHAEILTYRDEPMTLRQIGRECGVHHTTVLHVFEDEGIVPYGARKSKELTAKIKEESVKGGSFREISARAGCSPDHSRRVIKDGRSMPVETVRISLPPGLKRKYTPFVIDTPGHWGIISDIHIPGHDDDTLNLFVAECKRRSVKGVILNGDVLDCHELSVHEKDPSMPRYADELDLGKKFLEWLRHKLPGARIIYKHGNHEERLQRYVFNRAPALNALEGVNIQSWLHMEKHGIEDLPGKRVIQLGKLNIVHGHEFGKGSGGVNPARWLALKAIDNSMCGHFHRASHHPFKGLNSTLGSWSTGCACDLHPEWLPINQWENGAAWVELSSDGTFSVENKTVVNGRLV